MTYYYTVRETTEDDISKAKKYILEAMISPNEWRWKEKMIERAAEHFYYNFPYSDNNFPLVFDLFEDDKHLKSFDVDLVERPTFEVMEIEEEEDA